MVMGTQLKVMLVVLSFLLGVRHSSRADHHSPPNPKDAPKKGSSGSSGEEHHEGLRCYKCDPTDYNNYCRDFKPSLATPYDCTVSVEPAKPSKTSTSPLSASVDTERPYSCYKIKGDVAYGHGKVYGAQRYGCGHVKKVRGMDVTTTENDCVEVQTSMKGNKDFFDGIACNCDNADGCNSSETRYSSLTMTVVFLCFSTIAAYYRFALSS